MPTTRPRRHSLSSGDESFYPHPAKAGDLLARDGQRRSRLPRSKSTSNVFDAFNRPPGTAEHDMHNVALEQADIATLRELADLLRTTGPPPDRPAAYDECLRLSGSGEPKRWSLQSLRRNKRAKLQRHSLQSHLPENVIPCTTAEGHRYNAITRPVPEKNLASVPSFRSRYPVFLPQPQSPSPRRPPSSPRVWPERSSSRASPVSNPDRVATPGDLGNSPRSITQPIERYPSPRAHVSAGDGNKALPNGPSMNILRAMSNPVDEGFERSPGIPMKSLGPKKHHSMERAQGQAQPLVVAVHEQKTDQSELPQQDTSIHIRSPTKRSHDEIRRQSPSDFENGSPRSPEKPSQPLANILVRGKLAVPKENLPPESPGFPNMLAAINFPSPPKGSRPSSAASTAPSVASGQVPAGSRPMVQPRTSSRRACAPTSVSAASLDEIVLQKRPSSRRVNLDRPSRVAAAATPPSTTIEASSISGLPTTSVKEVDTAGGVVPDEAGRGQTGRTGLTGPFREESRVAIRGDNQRESLASQLTVTTNSSRQSTPTFSSPRSSSASEVSTQSNVTITDPKSFGGTAPSLGRTNPPVSEKSPKMDAVLFKTSVIDKDGVDWTEMDCPDLDRKHGEPKRPNLRLSTVPDQNVEDNPPPKSIIERRIARKAKVREYKMRDLDASRVDVADSPVLGYFAPTLGPNATSQGSTAPINNVRRPSTLSMATTTSELSNEPASHNAVEAPVDLRDVRSARVERSQTETVGDVPGVLPVLLRLSAIVSTEIEPIYPTTPRWHTSGITMSPIMVVADVESAPGSPMLRISALARPDSPSPRTMPRLNPLRISSHSRHKSQTVTISRNPATGAIERSASGPMDPKANRRSLITMPTPPMTPEPAHRKRLSLPPVQLNLQLTPRDRTPPVRCQEWEVLYVEEGEPESRLRSTTLKERVMREKLQKEKEITDIVAKTVGLPQKQAVYDDEPDSLPLEHNNAENLEKRVERLERTNDAWLCAMKPLLETMARTLDDMRVDDRCRSLKMSDFVIDMEAEAKRVTHSRRGEKEWASMTLQGTSGVESIGTQLKNAPETLIPTPLSPIPQELDTSPVTETRAAPTTSRTGRGPPGNEEKQPILPQEEEILDNSPEHWDTSSLVLTTTEIPGALGKQATPTQGGISKTELLAAQAAESGSVGKGEEFGDWPGLGPLIQELGSMSRKSREEREQREQGRIRGDSGNALNPLMRDLTSSSCLCAEEIRAAR